MSDRVNPGQEFVTVIADNTDRHLIIIGVADGFIDYLKKNGAMLQTAERNGTKTDIAILYAPTLNEVAKRIKGLLEASGKEVDIKLI